ncbi:hypothetical protein [Frankia sp. Cas4]|uniref:hypothetical protein n=1 Tax=Frankia sp. Cas4 TaxID=3073927 RepID=UPI002AD2BD1B|nr:hypothetical protein [Frankia sp. Cas4]
MNGRGVFRAFGAGMLVGGVLLFVVIMGGVVVAVSGHHNVDIPLLMTARSGTGSDILGLAVQPVGFLLWLVAVSFIIGLPLALVGRRGSADGRERDQR